MSRTLALVLSIAALTAAVVVSSTLAAGGPPPGKGPGGETLGNNLSVPAIFVGNTSSAPALRVPCATADTAGVFPTGPQSTVYTGYWLQKTEALWSSACATAASATVTAGWGANLTDAASLSAGKPVRVEVGLFDLTASGRLGYVVSKLTPELDDRLATYGTNGTTFLTGSTAASNPTRVWGPGTTLTIMKEGTTTPIFSGPMVAEINSLGSVVYGYNWGTQGRRNTPTAGTYTLTFTIPTTTDITIGGVVLGGVNPPIFDETNGKWTSLTITLTGK